jgi:hypothetical protein
LPRVVELDEGAQMYMAETILLVQQVFGGLNDFAPGDLLERLSDVERIGEAAEILQLMDVLPDEQKAPMRDFLASIPPAIDVALVAAVRSALERGLRAAFSWQPGYDFELRVWDISGPNGDDKPWAGLVNVHLVSPHPVEATPLS